MSSARQPKIYVFAISSTLVHTVDAEKAEHWNFEWDVHIISVNLIFICFFTCMYGLYSVDCVCQRATNEFCMFVDNYAQWWMLAMQAICFEAN